MGNPLRLGESILSYEMFLLDVNLGGLAALTTDVKAGGEVVAIYAHTVDVVVFYGSVLVDGDVFDAGLSLLGVVENELRLEVGCCKRKVVVACICSR